MVRRLSAFWEDNIFLTLAVLLAAGAVSGCAKTAPNDSYDTGLTVLCYHAIKDDADSIFDINENSFQKQMQYLSQNGYHAVSLNDLTAWMAGRKHLPSKSVLITFDDGHQSNYEKAYPILKKYGFVATLFLVADSLDTTGRLSTHQAKKMMQNGFSVGSHSLTHKPVIHMGKPSKDKEIRGSKLELEKKLDGKIEYFVYPFGYFDQQTKKDVAASGYVGAFTVIPGKNNQKTHPFELKRLLVTQTIDMQAFRELIAGDLNRLARLWQKDIPGYMLRGLYLPAEIEARALINVDNTNKVAQKTLQILKNRNYP